MRCSEDDLFRYGYGAFVESEEQPVAVFKAFFDDSGGVGGACAMAGFVSEPYRWVNLAPKWKSTLVRYGIEPPVFHMTDFENRQKAFASLAEDLRVPLFNDLVDLAASHVRFGVAQAAAQQDCDEVRDLCQRLGVLDFADPFALCAVACLNKIGGAIKRRELPAGSRVVCVFDDTGKRTGIIRRVFSVAIEQHTPGVFDGGIDFNTRHERVGIEVADILAYEVMKDFKRQHVDGRKRPARRSALALGRAGVPIYGSYYKPREFAAIMRDVFRWAEEEDAKRLALENNGEF